MHKEHKHSLPLQTDLFDDKDFYFPSFEEENSLYLTTQLITYLGNKRNLLNFIGQGIHTIQKRLKKEKLVSFDVFSGSGIVARYLKKHSELIIANDIEKYSYIINKCYLTNKAEFEYDRFDYYYNRLINEVKSDSLISGFIRKLYSPQDEYAVNINDRVFYTVRNAQYIDTVRKHIDSYPVDLIPYFLGPLLSEASIHSNTSGVFKGFYKNSITGCGQFGGNNKDALVRILGNIQLNKPILSNFNCRFHVYNEDTNILIDKLDEVDVSYIDPPYNQHPYGSNYFMLNLIVDYKEPTEISKVSGIPQDWIKSRYNNKKNSFETFEHLVCNIKSKFLLISFNSEGFINLDDMVHMLTKYGSLQVLETKYNTFRGCRNLHNREKHVKEYLYLLEKK